MSSNGPIPDKGHSAMSDINTTTTRILKLLQNLDIHKASGPDQISSTILKETAKSRSIYSSYPKNNFTYSMDTSTVPNDWRNTFIPPIKGTMPNPVTIGPFL